MIQNFGLVGKQIDYSFSPTFFQEKFQALGLPHNYRLFDRASLDHLKTEFKSMNINGFNVTQPYKTDIIPFLDKLSPEAEAVAAVNCVKIIDNQWIGYNTDAFGFHQSIKPFLAKHHERALILGRGGASRAVAYVFKNLGLNYCFVRRTASQANELSYEQVSEELLNSIQVIVNTTPLGTFPNVETCPNLNYSALTSSHFLIDLVYNPNETKFLSRAKAQGALTLNGKDMLIHQAEKSWDIWSNEHCN
ncbi:MAG: shikimate dehydrogenase family protein [Flavobacteriales bacterium]